tara:strand:- start:1183 stop:2208 length:1026 start_codon:yes stop_codon:yes gene_type:complete
VAKTLQEELMSGDANIEELGATTNILSALLRAGKGISQGLSKLRTPVNLLPESAQKIVVPTLKGAANIEERILGKALTSLTPVLRNYKTTGFTPFRATIPKYLAGKQISENIREGLTDSSEYQSFGQGVVGTGKEIAENYLNYIKNIGSTVASDIGYLTASEEQKKQIEKIIPDINTEKTKTKKLSNSVLNKVVGTIKKFEKGDRTEKHNNPGAIIYTPGSVELADSLGIKIIKGQPFLDKDGKSYRTAKFLSEQAGEKFLESFVERNAKKYNYFESEEDVKNFYSNYTGLPLDSNVVLNYTKDTLSNIKLKRSSEKKPKLKNKLKMKVKKFSGQNFNFFD